MYMFTVLWKCVYVCANVQTLLATSVEGRNLRPPFHKTSVGQTVEQFVDDNIDAVSRRTHPTCESCELFDQSACVQEAAPVRGEAREGGCPERHFAGGGICGAIIRNFGVCIAMC